ncbi:protein GbdR [Amylibacter marinus]|uniref:Protein GbdR n=1 Tax=Amylibacter marinus TaxID=1475483 RepID=A0ABQ5VWQ1_9RHOB|nr:helix-turn-helix domain-containing protein [Amylibacter marinus]GLQ35703.1 protein GbdR [Amylibacter marinus]
MTTAAPLKFDIILSDGFVSTEMSGVVDVLRLTNRVMGRPVFEYRYVSVAGGDVKSSADTWVRSDPLPQIPDADYAVFLGNSDLSFTSRYIERSVHAYSYAGAQVILLAEAAAMYIAANPDSVTGHTTHWENRVLLEENKGIFDVETRLAVTGERVITCAGLIATYDVMLQIASNHISKANILTVSSILLLDHVRAFETKQPGTADVLHNSSDPTIDRAIRLMQANLEEPMTTQALADHLRLTTRSLERQFRRHLGRSPGRFYRELRLIRAHNFLVNTNMSLSEVATACGFGSNFGRAYREYYGKTPLKMRKEKTVSKNESKG